MQFSGKKESKIIVKLYFLAQTPTKSILKTARIGGVANGGLSLAEKIRTLTRDVVVLLDRIPVPKRASQVMPNDSSSQQEVPENDPTENLPRQQLKVSTEEGKNQKKANKQKSNENDDASEPLRFCEDCAGSFDSIFEVKCQAYTEPYDDLLQQEIQINMNASKQLEEIDNRWNEESQKFSRLSHQLDKAHDKWAALFKENMELRQRFGSAAAITLHDHNYARGQ